MLCYETASHLNLLFCLALSDIAPAAEGGRIPHYYFQLEIEIQTPHSASYTGRRIPHYCWFGIWSPDTHMAPTYMQRCMPHYQWVIVMVTMLSQVSFDIILMAKRSGASLLWGEGGNSVSSIILLSLLWCHQEKVLRCLITAGQKWKS